MGDHSVYGACVATPDDPIRGGTSNYQLIRISATAWRDFIACVFIYNRHFYAEIIISYPFLKLPCQTDLKRFFTAVHRLCVAFLACAVGCAAKVITLRGGESSDAMHGPA